MHHSSALIVVLLFLFAGCAPSPPENRITTSRGMVNAWVVRTDFSNDQQWQQVRSLITAPIKFRGQNFYANVSFMNDQKYRDQSPHPLVQSIPDIYKQHFCFIVDRECLTNPQHPVLVVGFYPADKNWNRPHRDIPQSDIRTFRALPSCIQSIENNLSLANMDFHEFADHLEKDGIHHGFK